MNCLKFILCVLFLVFGMIRGWASAAATLTNHNLVYFQIDALPTAIPTNVIMLTGNLTNWQKLLTNVICNPCLIINPTDTYVPYRINSGEFGDSWWHYLVDGMVIDTNIFFAPGVTNRLYRQGQSLNYQGSNSPSLLVRDLNNKTISFGLNSVSSIGAFLTSMNQVQWGNTSDTLYMQSGTIQGNGIVGSLLNLGYNNNPFMVIRSCTNEIYGLIDINLANFSRLKIFQSSTNNPAVFDQQTGGIAGYSRGFEFWTNGGIALKIAPNSLYTGTGANFFSDDGTYKGVSASTFAATNGIIQQFKPSFYTNYVIGTATNQQFFLLSGTNQLITLPAAAGVKGIIYRFSMTNGWGSFILTNAADGATIRDGTSLSYTNIGINEVGYMSDGTHWWLASKGKQVFPAASWSLNSTITPVQDVITNVPFDQLEFNNSQGIDLKTNAVFAKPTQLWITNSGTYMITFSAVLKGTAGGSKISIWLRKNGSDVTRTRTDQAFSGATAQQCMTVNYFVKVDTPAYYELCAASHDASPPTIESSAANPTGYTAPAMPGVIVTINRVSDTWP